ncbi:MAG TPA: alcohol dehydrogenase catalytic domain-containing protein, partial [Acidimicrobiales bacterium]|nr:alcohol dehydrogenase catalytic domain-containing protein [Acidimicrobiales bacterium]
MIPPSMSAAVYVGDGAIAVQQVPVPEPGPDEVLVEVAQCGICGSDLHLVLEKYARPGTVLGHEWAGTVVATGEMVTGWEPGARVVSNPTPGCGTCRACRRGRPAVCVTRAAPDYLSFG